MTSTTHAPRAHTTGAAAPNQQPSVASTIRTIGAVAGPVLITVGLGLSSATFPVRATLAIGGAAWTWVGMSSVGRRIYGRTFRLGLWLASLWLALVVAAACLADILPLAEARQPSKAIRTPGLLRPDLLSQHPLGTDRQGLDILGELIYGARVSLIVGVGAVALGTLIGGTIGLLAGYYRGRVDQIVRLFTDTALAFPPLILLMGVVAVAGASVFNVTVALALLGAPAITRLVRSNTMRFTEREFVLAARSLGARDRRIIVREILPNVALPTVSYGVLLIAVLIVAEASLSFLGLSVQRPTPTWGNLIAAGQREFQQHPHPVFIAGAALFLTVLSLNRVGDELRRRLGGSRLGT